MSLSTSSVTCPLPPAQWADAFGEDVNFPRGRDGEGVLGFIQNQLAHSRFQREQLIDAGELLDNNTWKAVCELTLKGLQYMKAADKGPVNDHLRQLEDLIQVRPSPKEARTLMAGLVQAFEEPFTDKRLRWPDSFPGEVQALSAQLDAIEIVDNRPDRSLLEEIIDPEALQAQLSKVANPLNAALTGLGSMSLKDVGNGLQTAVSLAATKAASYFVFGAEAKPDLERAVESQPAESPLLSTLYEIEKKSAFFDEVITTGPRFTGGFWGKVLYVANALDTVGVLSVAEKVRPFLPAVPSVPVTVNAEAPTRATSEETSGVHPDVASLTGRAAPLEKPLAEFTSSLPPSALPTTEQTNIGAQSSVPSQVSGFSLEQAVQSITDALTKIDQALMFPSTAAMPPDVEIPMRDLKEQLEVLLEVEAEGYLQSPPVYPEQQPSPSWWESIASQLNNVLGQLATSVSAVAAASASTTIQLIRDNPGASVTAAFIAVSALYNELFPQTPDQTVDAVQKSSTPSPSTLEPTPEEPESPALHEERLEDGIEEILQERVAANKPAVLQLILERMYESTDHDLLNDEQLIEDVARLLQTQSPHAPGKTYLDLIHDKQVESARKAAITDALPDAADSPTASHVIKKREVPSFDENVDSSELSVEDLGSFSSVDTNETHNEAVLTQYLQTLEGLQSLDVVADVELDLDNDPSESPTDVARQIVTLLSRRRRSGWTDASRANGDSQLLTRYTTELSKYATGTTGYDALKVNVPMHSTFGQCWLNFAAAINSPFFTDWAHQAGLNLTSVTVNVVDSTLSGMVDGRLKIFTLNDDTGWATIARPILKSAEVIDPTHNGVAYPSSSSVPLRLVSAFYGESQTLSPREAWQRVQDLSKNQEFPPIQADDPLRPLELRSEASVAKQKQHLGDLYAYNSLTKTLADLITGKPDNASVDIRDGRMSAGRHSLFAHKYPQEADRMVSAQRFISAMGWNEPKTVEEVRNLIKVLSFALPESNRLGNGEGALSYPRPPTPAQQETIRNTVSRLPRTAAGGLLNHLLQYETFTSPTQGLTIALTNHKAKLLGNALEANLNVIATPGSATDWVTAALLLDLDPTPGQPRNHVAGYNLTQAANWGAKPSTVITNLQAHLVASAKVSSTTAPVAAHHLLGAYAPEFLVRNLPDNLVCGTHTWASLRMAVARIEQAQPGASAQMTFEQVMDFGSTDPISVGQEIATQSASVDPLIDWAIASGVIVPNAEDTYTPGQLKIATEKFDKVRNELAQARDYLNMPVPTRKELALAELERVFGKGLPYETPCLRPDNIPQNVRYINRSFLDVYTAGELTSQNWQSYNDAIPIFRFKEKFNQLNPIASIFEPAFTSYFDNLRTGSASIFKHLISQLPVDDRKSLEYGRQNFYSLRTQADDIGDSPQTPERLNALKGRHGVLIRTEYKSKVAYYEVFPSSNEIRKCTDLPTTLELNGTKLETGPLGGHSDDMRFATEQPFDWSAYQNGTAPQSGATSNVIIEEFHPDMGQARVYPPGYDYDRAPEAFYPYSRINQLATAVVDGHFLTGREKLRTFAWGSTDSEEYAVFQKQVADFLLGMVPFKSCIDNIAEGNIGGAAPDCILDAAGFIIPGGIAASQAVKVAGSGARLLPKALKMGWIMTSSLVSSANPFDPLIGAFKFGKNAVCKLGTMAYRAAVKGGEQLMDIYGITKAVDRTQLLKRADIAEGAISAGTTTVKASPVTALFKDGKWYAFDVNRNRPYGAPLDNFMPDSSIAVERTPLPDGRNPLVSTRVFDTEPHTIQRTSGTDVIVGDKVYRFDPAHPDKLDDILSPAYYKELEGFEQVCDLGKRRKKRSADTCFSKIIDRTLSLPEKRAQAIEHKRLYPQSGEQLGAPRLIHERRIYKCDMDYLKCKPGNKVAAFPLEFKPVTSGRIIANDVFGFGHYKNVDAAINAETRVVRINSIVNGVDDAREVRAMIVDVPGRIWGKTTYLVAEADTGLFYYCRYDGKVNNNIEFRRVDLTDKALGKPLIDGYHNVRDPYLIAAGGRNNNDFIPLPTLNSLHSRAQSDMTPADYIRYKSVTADLSEQQQRELIVVASTKLGGLTIEPVIRTVKIEKIKKPSGFNILPKIEQNKIYANEAKKKIDKQIAVTGLGPENQVITSNQEAIVNLNDIQRNALAAPVVLWEYAKRDVPATYELLLKTGAGNCDQMAAVAMHLILESGGTASVWRVPGHVFTVVGRIEPVNWRSTLDFADPSFQDVWIIDAWAGISCKAENYVQAYKDKMAIWEKEGRKISTVDKTVSPPEFRLLSPTDPAWINNIDGLKEKHI